MNVNLANMKNRDKFFKKMLKFTKVSKAPRIFVLQKIVKVFDYMNLEFIRKHFIKLQPLSQTSDLNNY